MIHLLPLIQYQQPMTGEEKSFLWSTSPFLQVKYLTGTLLNITGTSFNVYTLEVSLEVCKCLASLVSKHQPSWLFTNNTQTVIVILILSQFPHLSVSIPPFPLLLLLLCGQQAFSLLSVESAKHSHFWAADRQELADSVERLLRKREILKMRRGKKGRGGGSKRND